MAELGCSMKRKYLNSSEAGNSARLERNTEVSQTVPDMALSIREIMSRYASGTLDDLQNELFYSEDLPDLRGLDISQLMEMKSEAQQDVMRLKQEIADRKKPVETPIPDRKKPVETPIPEAEIIKTEE